MSENQNMTRGRPMRLLILFALPMMAGNICQQLYTVTDTAIVGRGVGMDALAALGTVDWLNWMLFGIATGLTAGFSVRISHYFGEGDIPKLKRVVGISLRLSILIACILTLLGQIFLKNIIVWLRVPQDLKSMAELYSRILFGGLPAVIFYNYCACVLRAVGNSKTPLIAMLISSATNIALDLLAVFVLHYGIAGAAVATVISQCLSGIFCAVKIWKNADLRISRADLSGERTMETDLMKLGVPIAFKNMMISVGGMVIQSVANGFGVSFIAGFTATNKFYGVLEVAALSYGYAVTTFIGQNFGARKPERIKRGLRDAVILSLITAAILGVICFILGRPIARIFISSDNPVTALEAENTAYLYLCAMGVGLPVLYMAYVYQAALQGVGRTYVSSVSGTLELIVRSIIAGIVALTHYQYGIFAAEVGSWFVAGIYQMVVYHRNAAVFLPKAVEDDLQEEP